MIKKDIFNKDVKEQFNGRPDDTGCYCPFHPDGE